jgi:hypothetical protein
MSKTDSSSLCTIHCLAFCPSLSLTLAILTLQARAWVEDDEEDRAACTTSSVTGSRATAAGQTTLLLLLTKMTAQAQTKVVSAGTCAKRVCVGHCTGADTLQPAPGKRVFHRDNGGRRPGTSLHPPHSARARQPPPLDPKALMLSMGEGGTTTPRIYARTSGARRPGSPLHPVGFVRFVSPPKSPEAGPVLKPEGRRRVYWRGVAAERQPGSPLHPESPRLSRSVSPTPRGRGGGKLPEATLDRGGSIPSRNVPEESGGQRYYTSWGARKPGSPIHSSPPRVEGSGVSCPRIPQGFHI